MGWDGRLETCSGGNLPLKHVSRPKILGEMGSRRNRTHISDNFLVLRDLSATAVDFGNTASM